jgi:uncharacterized protein DUF3761
MQKRFSWAAPLIVSLTSITGGGFMARNNAAGQGGCLGCSGFALLLFMFVGLCSDSDGPTRSPSPSLPVDYTASSIYSAPEPRETLYLHGRMNVREGAGKHHAIVKTLPAGEAVRLGKKDERGWAPLYDGVGQRVGYMYRASGAVRPHAPPPPSTRSTGKHPSGASALCRDGTYSYSANRRGTCSHHGGVARWL